MGANRNRFLITLFLARVTEFQLWGCHPLVSFLWGHSITHPRTMNNTLPVHRPTLCSNFNVASGNLLDGSYNQTLSTTSLSAYICLGTSPSLLLIPGQFSPCTVFGIPSFLLCISQSSPAIPEVLFQGKIFRVLKNVTQVL